MVRPAARDRSPKPYYDLIASIAAEEFGHIELVSAAINVLLTGGHTDGGAADVTGTPLGHGVENKTFPEARKFEGIGVHRTLYRFSPDDYRDAGLVWQGAHPDDGQPLEFVDGPPEGRKTPELVGISEAFAPEYQAEEIFEMAQKLCQKARS